MHNAVKQVNVVKEISVGYMIINLKLLYLVVYQCQCVHVKKLVTK